MYLDTAHPCQQQAGHLRAPQSAQDDIFRLRVLGGRRPRTLHGIQHLIGHRGYLLVHDWIGGKCLQEEEEERGPRI